MKDRRSAGLVSLPLSAVLQNAANGTSRSDRLNRRVLEADEFCSRTIRESADRPPDFRDTPGFRVAIVSLLFNWPSTGGGIVHTAELAQFLAADGFDVCHFYAVNASWGVGSVADALPYNSCAIHFDEASWTREGITNAFRHAVDGFQPDVVIVTDSWNSKGMLADAVDRHPYFLRLAAMECLCPLNNVRLLASPEHGIRQCHKSQLSHRNDCLQCVRDNQHCSGSLHRDERQLVDFESPAFGSELRRSFANAEGILVVNPLIGALCEPFARRVHVIPSGFDARRFDHLPHRNFGEGSVRILFAGLVNELMKGFAVLFDACWRLWAYRQDFELVVTADPGEFQAPFLRCQGWQNQQELPRLMAECDIVVIPTIAQEALGRTAVEAMGAARPVVASRLGGLPFTVVDGSTGLLFEPGNAHELSAALQRFMTHPVEAAAMGAAGRRKFESEHTWDHIIAARYRPLFSSVRGQA